MSREGRKITYACEMCRKRKARCSGVAPCTFCQKHAFTCAFDRNRQRRGPRGSRQKSLTQRSQVAELPTTEPQHFLSLSEESGAPSNNSDNHVAACTRSPVVYHDITRSEFQDLLPSIKAFTKDEQCHLLELFETHANEQQLQIIPADLTRSWIKTRRCPEYLLLAIYACAVRYSRKLSGSIESQLCLQVRQKLCTVREEECLAHILAHSALAFIEFRRGYGAQAWRDIAVARALIEACRTCGLPQPPEISGLEHAAAYVDLTTAMYSLGHPLLCKNSWMSSQNLSSQGMQGSTSRQTCRLLQLACRIQEFWAQPAHITSEMRHWDYDSQFMDLKHELDESLVHQSDDLRFSSSRLMSKLDQGEAAGEYLLWSLAWHCAVILLNRVFLPIPPSNNKQHGETLNYPGAPSMFIGERLSVLESSAAAISIMCSDVIGSGHLFMPPFIGYGALQSSLVHLNTIRGQKQTQHTKALENLKINCTLLTGMRGVYKSAEVWLTQLMDIVGLDTKYAEDQGSKNLFRNYFSRFSDVQEVAFLQMDFPSDVSACGNTDSHTSELIQIRRTEPQRPIPSSEESSDSDAWLSQYRLDLEDQMSNSSDSNVICAEETADEVGLPEDQFVLDQDNQHYLPSGTDDPPVSRDMGQGSQFSKWQSDQRYEGFPSLGVSSEGQIPYDWASTSLDLFLHNTPWDTETALYSTDFI